MELTKVKEEIKMIRECLKGASNDAIRVSLWKRKNLLSRIAMKLESGMQLTEAERGAI